ncbi:MAG: imidazoleglycerol-phosphate dehydratase HisB [Clostridia bacterium]|nr:imidazoleglycerol-phosphate dehydratase HisB [Clostridia bacterium]
MREAVIKRKTNETDIEIKINLDGTGNYMSEDGKSLIDTGCGFFNHMMELFAKHSCVDMSIKCKGDVEVDFHHSIEDIGICLGMAFKEALGDKKGINRYGWILLPMDEALIMSAIDFSDRGMLCFNVEFPNEYKVGDMDTELVEEFMIAFSRNAGITLHIEKFAGTNIHHIVEGIFKALARCLKQAVAMDPRNPNAIPSTKGKLA